VGRLKLGRIGWIGVGVLLSVATGAALALTAESSLSILILLTVVGLFALLSPQLAFYAALLFLPFSFRYIIPDRSLEVQTPTEPLLGMLVFFSFIRLVFDHAIGQPRDFTSTTDPAEVTNTIGDRSFPFTWPVLLFILVHFISTINAPDTLGSIKGAIRASVYVLACFLAYRSIPNLTELRRLAIVVFPPAVAAVIWTVVVLVYNLDAWQWTSAYQGSPFTNYTAYGQFTAVFLLIVLSRLLIDRSAYDRTIWIGLLIIFTGGMLMCFSRGVWLALIISTGFLWLNTQRSDLGKKLIFLGLAVTTLLILLVLPGTSGLIQERLFTMFDLQFASNRSRLLRWGQALLMFLNHPIMGNGYGAFAMIYKENPGLSGLYKAQFQLGAHSEHLRILAEMGIVGIVIWIAVLFTFFRFGLSAVLRIQDGFFRSLIVGLIAVEFSMSILFLVNDLPEGDVLAVPFWVIYGLLPAVVRMADQADSQATNDIVHNDANWTLL